MVVSLTHGNFFRKIYSLGRSICIIHFFIKLPSLGSHLFSTLQDNPMKLNIQIGKTPHLIDVETEVASRLIPRTTVKVTGEKNEKGAFHFFRVAYPVIRPCKQHLPIFT